MANKQINAILSLRDKFSTPLFKVADNVDKANKQMTGSVARANRSVRKVEKGLDRMFKGLFKWGKRLAIVGGGLSLKVGWEGLKELDDGARKVKSIAKDALELEDIKDGLLKTSSKVGVDVKDVAEGQYMAISSSVDPKESLKYAELAVKVQKAGFTDSKNAIDLITSIQNAYGESGIKNAYKLADQLLHTQNRGKIEVGEMTQHYGKLIPLFSQAGVGYEEMNAGMATLTKMGMRPAEASTALAGAIRIMMKPTKQTNEALSELGLNFGAAELKAKGFGGLMAEVMKATGGDMDKITKIFPNARAMLAGAALTGKEGMSEYQNILKELQGDEVTGSLETAFETIQNSIGNQWDKLKQNIKNTNTKFYMNYEGDLAEKLQEVNRWFEENPEYIEKKLSDIADAMGRVIDKAIDFVKFINDNKHILKPIGAAIGGIYGAIKLIRAGTFVKDLAVGLKLVSKAGKFTKLGKVVMALGAIAGLLTAIIERRKYLQKDRESKSKYVDIPGLPMAQTGEQMGTYDDPNKSDSFSVVEEFLVMLDALNEGIEKLSQNINLVKENWESVKEAFRTVGDIIHVIGLIGGALALLSNFAIGGVIFVVYTIFGIISSIIGRIGEVIGGLVQIVTGVFQTILGIITFNGPLYERGIENILEGIYKTVVAIWGMVIDFITKPIDAIINLGEKAFGEKAEGIREKWEKVKEFLEKPITGTINIVQNVRERVSRFFGKDDTVEGKYTGAMSWRGGIVQVHEKGGEILDLPGGTRIFPHDRSVRMAYEEGKNATSGQGGAPIVLNFYGDLYGEEDHINKVGRGITDMIMKELNNM